MSKESERVVTHEAKGNHSPMLFRRVDICYADKSPFYSGWIQDFGDARTGPTFFDSNYERYSLERERVHRLDRYWNSISFNQENIGLRSALVEDLDEIIDLNFQNYFDGGYNRISAYQGLNHLIDDDHETVVITVDNMIVGFLYINWVSHASRGEAYFDSLFCAPAMRNKGVGRALIAAGLDRIAEKGFARVSGEIIGTHEHCEHIAQMLDKHGFELDQVFDHGPGWVVANMSKTL